MKNEHIIKVTVDGKKWTDALDNAFKKESANVTIDGFRKGKAPKKIFIKKYGIESLYNTAIDMVADVEYRAAIEKEKLVPECMPSLNVTSIDENHVDLEFKIITKPEIKLGKYKDLGIKMKEAKVSKKEIEDAVIRLKSDYAEIIVKENGTVADGNVANIDFEGFKDGVAFDGGKGEAYDLEIGSGSFIPGFEEQVIGMAVGEEKDLHLTFPKDYHAADLAGKEVVFKVKVNSIKERVEPELNDEFFKDLDIPGVTNEKELEKNIEEGIKKEKTKELEDEYLKEIFDKVIENSTCEVNPEIIDSEVDRMLQDMDRQLNTYGMNLGQYLQMTQTTIEALREQYKAEAKNRVLNRYILDAVIKEEKLKATKKEVEEHAETLCKQYGMEKDEFVAAYGGMDVMEYDLLIHKAVDVLKGE